MRLSTLARRPALTVLVGAVAIAFSGILFRLSHVSPSTGAFYRCVWALPALWLIVRWEERRWGKRPLRARYFAWLAGAFFAADLVLWHNAIDQVGAGLATVLGNTQVVLVGLIAWLLLARAAIRRRRSSRSRSCSSASSSSRARSSRARTARTRRSAPSSVLLTGVAYTGFLLDAPAGQPRERRTGRARSSTRRSPAALGCALDRLGRRRPRPDAVARRRRAGSILLALSSQVLGWLLITISLPRLPAGRDVGLADRCSRSARCSSRR